MTVICGIDPGASGGIAIIGGAGELQFIRAMPMMKVGKRRHVDLAHIAILMEEFYVEKVYIEKVFTKPGDGRLGVLSYAEGAFKIEGLLFGVRIPYGIVRPQDWMKLLGLKADRIGNGANKKTENIQLAKQLWPQETWLATNRCKNIHTGMIDAALIAFYGLKLRTEKCQPQDQR